MARENIIMECTICKSRITSRPKQTGSTPSGRVEKFCPRCNEAARRIKESK